MFEPDPGPSPVRAVCSHTHTHTCTHIHTHARQVDGTALEEAIMRYNKAVFKMERGLVPNRVGRGWRLGTGQVCVCGGRGRCGSPDAEEGVCFLTHGP